ncbi:cysteine-rich KTR domain-containing protein [Lacticaseibacillus paracasei]
MGLCPICGRKTRLKVRKDTVLKNFPLYCPKCKQETADCKINPNEVRKKD